MKNNKNIANIIITICVLFCMYGSYYLLLQDTFLHASIAHIIRVSHTFERRNHVLVLGLIPIYIAMMVFGTSLLGIYAGSRLQILLHRKRNSRN